MNTQGVDIVSCSTPSAGEGTSRGELIHTTQSRHVLLLSLFRAASTSRCAPDRDHRKQHTTINRIVCRAWLLAAWFAVYRTILPFVHRTNRWCASNTTVGFDLFR